MFVPPCHPVFDASNKPLKGTCPDVIKVDRSCVRPAGSLKRAAAAAALAGPYRSADDIRDISEIDEIVGTREQVRRCQTSGGLPSVTVM